jgi:hypothetical protein
MRTLTLLLLSLLLASLALADEGGVHVVPFGPTTATPVDVHIPLDCFPEGHTVDRAGNVIKITLLDPSCPPVLPIQQIYNVRLPELLAPGEYRVEVFVEGQDGVLGSTEFVVRNADPRPFEVHPFAVPASGGNLRLRINSIDCGTPCEGVTIEVDGVPATNLAGSSDHAVWFTPPPHAPGPANVRVAIGSEVVLLPAAIYYYDRPERSVFERVLFPVLFSANGANGSRWVSEAALSNPRPWFVQNGGAAFSRLAPGEIARAGDGWPRGVVLHAPRPEAPMLAGALRVRDVSRQAHGFGTQIPVVREDDFTHGGEITLLNVPLDPRYRVKLRLYALDPMVVQPFGLVTLRDTQTKAVKLGRGFQLARPASADEPWYAELDLPPGAAGERVNVFVEFPLDATAWAFATVTNNETQQVTTVTP